MEQTTSPETTLHSGIIAVVGAANAGKSTLINRLAQEPVSIVSPVAQTTRNTIRMILTEERGQMVWLDTPGVHKAQSPLGKRMNQVARQAVDGADVVLLLIDCSESPKMETEGWMRRLLFAEEKVVIGLNKTDRPEARPEAYRELWKKLEMEKDHPREVVWHTLSGLQGQGVDELVDLLFTYLPPGPFLFPEEMLTDFPKKLALADVIREAYFMELKQELPHAIAVRIDEIDESAGWKIKASLFVDRNSQKGIVIGHKGRLMKKVQTVSARKISEMYDVRPVQIRLWVKVEPKWNQNYFLMRELGYL